MAEKNEVRFYLEKRKDKASGKLITKNVPIRLVYSLNGKRLEYFPGIRIDAHCWDSENMKVRRGFDGYAEINKELVRLRSKIEDAVDRAKVLKEEITINGLREEMKGKLYIPKGKKSFKEYFAEYLERSALVKSSGTIRAIRSSYNHFLDFEKDTKNLLDFKNINQEFYDNFLDYCFNERDLKNAYVGKLIKDLKAFLNWATERGYNSNLEFKKKSFRKLHEEIEILFLTYKELLELYNFDFSDSEKLNAMRDLFCFGCFTGMRLSDILSLSPENIHPDRILFRVEKTEQSNIIPFNPFSKAIIEKYQGKFEKCLPSYFEQYINKHLKIIFKKVGINRKVQIIHFQGAKKIKKVAPLHEVVTFHLSKKTFMTNFLAKGGSLITAMSITGNKDFKTAKRYFKVVDSLKEQEMAKVFGS